MEITAAPPRPHFPPKISTAQLLSFDSPALQCVPSTDFFFQSYSTEHEICIKVCQPFVCLLEGIPGSVKGLLLVCTQKLMTPSVAQGLFWMPESELVSKALEASVEPVVLLYYLSNSIFVYFYSSDSHTPA